MSEVEKTTLEQILQAARSEFLEKGYKAAALREISQKAGVTTGALYGYFKNKEDLFGSLVKEAYGHILYLYRNMLHSFSTLSPEEQRMRMGEYSARGMREMIAYMYEKREAFKLLLCCSEGTSYSDLVHDMVQMDVDATRNFQQVTSASGVPVQPVNSKLEPLLISGMFTTFFELIVQDIPQEEAQEYSSQLLEFYSAGWAKVMGLS